MIKKYPSILAWTLKAFLLACVGGCSVCPQGESLQFSTLTRSQHPLRSWEPVVVLPASSATSQKDISHPYSPYLLDTGDRVRILVYSEPELSQSYTLDPEGMVSLPLLGSVEARGTSPRELAEIIRSRLQKENYLKDPKVAVNLEQNRPFFIHGAVKNGGQYPFVANMSVETAVAIAGGLQKRANDQMFRVTRRTPDLIEKKDVPSDYYIKPGDLIFVYGGFF